MTGRERRQAVGGWIMLAMGVLCLGVFPLLLLRNEGGLFDWSLRYSYSGFTQTKRDTAWLLGGVCSFGMLASLLLGAGRTVDWKHPGRLLVAACFGWMALSMCFGSAHETLNSSGGLTVWEGATRYEGMSTQLCYLALFMALSSCRPKVKWVAVGAAVGLAGYAVIVALQYLGMDPLDLYPGARSIYTNYEFQGTIGNIDMGIGYLCLVTPLLLGCYVVWGGKLGTALLPFGLVGVLLLLMMDVTAGLLGLLFGLGLLALCRPSLRSRCLVVLGLAVLCLLLRKLTGLPWLDGLEAPWYCTPRTDDPSLPSLTGGEALIFPWNVSVKKLLLLVPAALLLLGAWLCRKHPGRAVRLRWPLLLIAVVGVGGLLAVRFVEVPQSMGALYQLHEVLCGRGLDSFGS